jgi:hypothetical protein
VPTSKQAKNIRVSDAEADEVSLDVRWLLLADVFVGAVTVSVVHP